MKMKSIGCGLLLLTSIFISRGLLACGDKYFVTVQGARYLLASLTSDSNILIYRNPASEVQRLFESNSIEKTLLKTGFIPTVVTTEAEFRSNLAHGGWAIIVVGTADAQKIRSGTPGNSGAAVLPVVDKASSAQLKEIKAQYPVVLKATTSKSEPLLDVIFDAYVHRSKPKTQIAKAGSR